MEILPELAQGAAEGTAAVVMGAAMESGKKWIHDRFANHRKEIIQKAENNTSEFFNKLALKVNALEQESEITKSLMAMTMGEPSFSVVLQKAVVASSQTDDTRKHEILSDLIAQRLKADSESIYAVTSPMAVDAVSHCTPNQLHIMGAAAAFRFIHPPRLKIDSQAKFERYCAQWLIERFGPYQSLKVGVLDFAHLQSVSCANVGYGEAEFGGAEEEISRLIREKFSNMGFSLVPNFSNTLPIGHCIERLWDRYKIRNLSLTTVGRLIGILVSDRDCGAEPTDFEYWQNLNGASQLTPEEAIHAMMRDLD